MKRMISSISVAFVMTSTLWANQFNLKHDATGQVYGPFDATSGAKVIIGKTSFTVVTGDASESPLAKALAGIILPRVDLRYASPMDSIQYVKETVNAMNPKAPINIITRELGTAPLGTFPKTVTLQMTSVSVTRVLQEICAQADLKMSEEDGVLVISPKK